MSTRPLHTSACPSQCVTSLPPLLLNSTKFEQLNTTHGPIKLEIFCEAVPKASENFLALCASGRYDGTAVHRIIKDFIMQTGAPAGDTKAKVSSRTPSNGGEKAWRHTACRVSNSYTRTPSNLPPRRPPQYTTNPSKTKSVPPSATTLVGS